jgi:hypothetical protein
MANGYPTARKLRAKRLPNDRPRPGPPGPGPQLPAKGPASLAPSAFTRESARYSCRRELVRCLLLTQLSGLDTFRLVDCPRASVDRSLGLEWLRPVA